MITARRQARIEQVLSQRSYNLTVVLEGLYDTGNVSAILRSCDSFGIQRVNLITTSARYKVGRNISTGAHKWLDIHQYSNCQDCAEALKKEGYSLLATHLTHDSEPIGEIDFTRKIALVFGNEHAGVSPEMVDLCEGCIIIPMSGFAQSFNVSVAASIAMYHGVSDRIAKQGHHGDMDEVQTQTLRERFYRRSVRRCDLVLEKAGL